MFIASKLLSALTQPIAWLALWWLGALLLLARWPKAARRMLWVGLWFLALLGWQPLPDALLRPLEGRYAVPAPQQVDEAAGLIVLGGSTGHPSVFLTHGQVPLGEAAERLTAPVALMRDHPALQLVFSGGEGALFTTGVSEAQMVQRFLAEQGVDMSRVRLEGGSRTTRENAQAVAKLLGKACRGQRWLLVTSAWHMPRAMREFEAAGCTVTAYPVDHLTADATPWTEYSMARSLMRWQLALHEWVGQAAYALTRKSPPS